MLYYCIFQIFYNYIWIEQLLYEYPWGSLCIMCTVLGAIVHLHQMFTDKEAENCILHSMNYLLQTLLIFYLIYLKKLHKVNKCYLEIGKKKSNYLYISIWFETENCLWQSKNAIFILFLLITLRYFLHKGKLTWN